ncbi:MAG: transglutaminase-like domain-containing protein [Verrucomicrobiae bacterium]|nr:transglutaminase-like domain-containing protein [Verrucomicrobiae bacterium]MDW8344014.1 transglutaminase-like domain-containing protein [Verrucomicrobiae bacterium]
MTALDERGRRALVTLLEDDDPQLQQLLAEQLARMGPTGCEVLEQTLREGSPAARRHAARLLRDLREQQAEEKFLRFCRNEANGDLETGNWLLAKTRYPTLEEHAYRARLDQMAQELRERLTGRETPRATVEVCNHYLFQLLNFRGNVHDYYDPDNSYLNRVLDRRLGIPISLSVVYLLLGQRLGWPLFGVGLPGHFLLTWRSPDVAFFIDPFHGGQLLDEAACRRLAIRHAGVFHDHFLQPVPSRKILARQCHNLYAIYRTSDPRRAERMRRFLEALSD